MKEIIAAIDCNADPIWIIPGFEIEEHIKGGTIEFDPGKILFYKSESQKGYSSRTPIVEIRNELEGKVMYNIHVLDHLMKNAKDIPREWRWNEDHNLRHIHFFGTVYRNDIGTLCVWSMKWRPNDDTFMIAGEGDWVTSLESITGKGCDAFSEDDCVMIGA